MNAEDAQRHHEERIKRRIVELAPGTITGVRVARPPALRLLHRWYLHFGVVEARPLVRGGLLARGVEDGEVAGARQFGHALGVISVGDDPVIVADELDVLVDEEAAKDEGE